MSDGIFLRPVGVVRGGRREATDDHWDRERAVIALDPEQLTPDAVFGLDAFSHVEIVFVFDRVRDEEIVTGARHPRGRSDWPKVGIFAQRAKARPNRIGVSVCALIAVHGLDIHVQGLDAIDGTPVLDIKPVMREFLPRGDIRQPEWATEMMREYW